MTLFDEYLLNEILYFLNSRRLFTDAVLVVVADLYSNLHCDTEISSATRLCSLENCVRDLFHVKWNLSSVSLYNMDYH